MDPISNLAYGTVATAPSPATSGTSLTLTTGQGANFPVGSFDVVVWPAGSIPTSNNAEIARATRTSGSDALTLVRVQYGTTAQSVTTSYAVYQAIDQNLFSQLAALNPVPGGAPLASVANQQILSSTRKVPRVMDSRNYGGTATGGSTTTLINSGSASRPRSSGGRCSASRDQGTGSNRSLRRSPPRRTPTTRCTSRRRPPPSRRRRPTASFPAPLPCSTPTVSIASSSPA